MNFLIEKNGLYVQDIDLGEQDEYNVTWTENAQEAQLYGDSAKASSITPWVKRSKGEGIQILRPCEEIFGKASFVLVETREKWDPKEAPVLAAVWWGSTTEFFVDDIIEEHNEEWGTNFTVDDIKDYWVKWNTLHLEMNDGTDIVEEGDYDCEIDMKRPRVIRAYTRDYHIVNDDI